MPHVNEALDLWRDRATDMPYMGRWSERPRQESVERVHPGNTWQPLLTQMAGSRRQSVDNRFKTDKPSGIVSDPNCLDDLAYLLRLIGKVITFSLETVEIVEGLPGLGRG